MSTPTLEAALQAASGGFLHAQALDAHLRAEDQVARVRTQGSQHFYRPQETAISSGTFLDDLSD